MSNVLPLCVDDVPNVVNSANCMTMYFRRCQDWAKGSGAKGADVRGGRICHLFLRVHVHLYPMQRITFLHEGCFSLDRVVVLSISVSVVFFLKWRFVRGTVQVEVALPVTAIRSPTRSLMTDD